MSNRFYKPRNVAPVMDAADYVRGVRKASPVPHEERAQADVMRRIAALVATNPPAYADLWYTHHSPNEQASETRRKRNGALGVRAGHPDLVNYSPRTYAGRAWVAIGLELKISPNTPSSEQENYLMHLHRCGWFVEVVSAPDSQSLADATWQLLCEYLGLPASAWLPLMSSMQGKRGRR